KMILHASDVEEILKVKAAFTLAVSRLLREAALPAAKIGRVFLAGSLGSHVQPRSLIDLGFLPPGLGTRVTLCGNTSLAGAALLLRHKELREPCTAWAERATSLDLAGDPAFGEAFAKHMVFAWRS
ncbi:ASKHA domain-containing protein, partial [Desulfovibrio sp. OttesenSCG-928-O18]|nr:ASKHA domain-containing protein [Desulfovibrio sp. OttesenSCG-928-O18]